MADYHTIDTIANGIHAANKIRDIKNSVVAGNARSAVKPSSVELISEALRIISAYYPGGNTQSVGETLHKSQIYQNAYRDLKHHVKSIKEGNRLDRNIVMKTLVTITPFLDTNSKSMIEKILKINDILYS